MVEKSKKLAQFNTIETDITKSIICEIIAYLFAYWSLEEACCAIDEEDIDKNYLK